MWLFILEKTDTKGGSRLWEVGHDVGLCLNTTLWGPCLWLFFSALAQFSQLFLACAYSSPATKLLQGGWSPGE